MEFRFSITFKRGPVVAEILGERAISSSLLTVGEVQEIPELEAKLERLTGLRVHIEQIN